jgi:hypothetical protein
MKLSAALSLACLSLAVPAFAQTASGTLTVNGKKTALDHVVAVRKDGNVKVLIGDRDIPAATFADSFAMMDVKGLSGVTVEITPEGKIPTGSIYSPTLTKFGGDFSLAGSHKWEGKVSGNTIEGTLSVKPGDFFDNTYEFSTTFRAPIVSAAAAAPPAPVLKGKPLPEGGGDPGKAYVAYILTVRAGNIPQILGAVSGARAKEAKPEDLKQMLPLIQAMLPKDIKITGGAVDGDHPTLTGKEDGGTSTGTVDLVREGGRWKVEKENWKSKLQ